MRGLLCLLVGALLVSASGLCATTYTYSGPAFTNVAQPPFTATGRVTGSFTVASPLPPLNAADIGNLLVKYSFTDGINTYSSTDPNARVFLFWISTDSTGAIYSTNIVLERWKTGSAPHVPSTGVPFPVPDRLSAISVNLWSFGVYERDQVVNDGVCTDIFAGDVCNDGSIEQPSFRSPSAMANGMGTFWTAAADVTATPAAVPTLSDIGLLALSASVLLMLLAIKRVDCFKSRR